jgi:small conductance mechanosensitive channel
MEEITEGMSEAWPYVISAFKALVVIIIGWIIAGWASRAVRRKVNKTDQIDKTLGNFAASVVRWVVLMIVFVAVLNLFGIQATSIVAMLGAATLAIGLALQGTLSDLAAGFMLILFRPYRIDQYVDIGGTSGTVTDINLFFTELVTPDNLQIIIPNGQAWGAIITNYSHYDQRRVDLVFGIDYEDDADKAIDVISGLVKAEDRILDDPEPFIRVTNLGESSVDITARLWTMNSDFWDVKFAMTKKVKEAFDKAGISIPYPHSVEIQKAV